ncbi:MAG: hypothetical protein LAO79_24285 [Acidobacteriia bacterium]|nr:hypothetical protein [Terriglobia bacterium]
MKDYYRGILRRWISPKTLGRIKSLSHIDDRLRDVEAARAGVAELFLRREFPDLFADGSQEFSLYSQNGEDGILLSLIARTGAAAKTFVEIGTEDARECNTAILAFLLGWDGLMLEANPLSVDAAKRLAARLLARKKNRLEIRQAMVTAENVNTLIGDAGVHGKTGVLSIDVDGIDYWLWKAVTVIQPRIVVIEYNASFGAERAVTVPYSAEFSCPPGGYYHGASLRALENLGKQLGYVLAAVESAGVNAFFVREDICPPELRGRTAAELYRPHRERTKTCSPEEQWAKVQSLPLIDAT